MKKQTVSLLVLMLAIISIFFSCRNNVNKSMGRLEFDSIQVNQTTYLFGDTTKPGSNLIIDFTYANSSDNARLKDSLNSYLLSLCLGDRYMGIAPAEAVEKYAENYATDYRKDLEPMYKKDEQEKEDGATMESWYSYYKKIKGNVQLYQNNLLVYCMRYEEFTGGAHGIYMTTFLNINLRTLTPVRLEDLFVDDFEAPLTELLWNQLMTDNHVSTRQELEDLGYTSTGDLEPTENFYLGKKGITFHYNVYDIAPYVMGPTQITLPYDSLQHLLADTEFQWLR